MAGMLVLVWGIHCCLMVMHLAYVRDQLWRKSIRKNNYKYNYNYSSWEVYQAILPSAHTPLTGVNTLHLHCSTSVVLLWLLSSSLLGELLPLLISGGYFLVLRSGISQSPPKEQLLSLTPCLGAVGGTPTSSSSSSSSSSLQPSASWLPP